MPEADLNRVTSYDVARRAGVSQSAVSRAFRDGASISPTLRARVQRAANELGYAPSNIARALISQRSGLFGVLVTEMTARSNTDLLFHLGHEIQESGNRMLVFTLPTDSAGDGIAADLLAYHVDGVIAAATIAEANLQACIRRGVPVILYNRQARGAASVGADQEGGMHLLAAHLAATGSRDAALLGGPQGSPVSEQRLRGARMACAEFGISLRPTIHADYAHDTARAITPQLLAGKTRPDTVICANDAMALGVIDACRHDLGLRVPQDIAVTGFDNIAQAGWPAYGLTTVAQPFAHMTRTAVQMLRDHHDGRMLAAEHRLMPVELIVRSSTRG